MKKNCCLLLVGLLLSNLSFAQKTPDWTLALEGTPEAIFVHTFTGIPVVETSTHYYGVDYPNKQILWTSEKSSTTSAMNQAAKLSQMSGAGAAAGVDLTETETFSPIPMTPYATINGSLVDVGSGNILYSGISAIIEHNFLPDAYALLIKFKKAGGSDVCLLYIDLEQKSVVWQKELGSDLGKQLAKMAGVGFNKLNAFTPQVTKQGDIVYKYEKKLMLLDPKDGSAKWENSCDPGTFFMNNTQTHLVVVEQAGGLAGLSGSAAFGRKMFALDLATGQNLWKEPVKLNERFVLRNDLNEEQFLVAHEDGINVYDYKTGTALWKKDFKSKNFKEVQIKDEGFEVLYGNKVMLVNKETGKDVWKKALKLDIDEDEDGNVTKREYKKGMLICSPTSVGLFDYEKGKKIWKMSISKGTKIAFDDVSSKVAILDGGKFFLFNPDELEKSPKKLKLDIEKPEQIGSFETRQSGYYLQGLNEYFFLDKDGNMLYHNYFKPLATDRLAKSLLMAGSIATGGLSIEVTVTVGAEGEAGTQVSGGLFMSSGDAKKMGAANAAQTAGYAKLREASKLRNASKSSNEFGYFVKGEKVKGEGDKMSLIKVDKNSGKEVDEFSLGNDRKVVYELMPNINLGFVIIDGILSVYTL